jgi:hypothetical protein
MLYRFKECLSRKQCGQASSNSFLYRGVTKTLAELDLGKNRLHFSRAIIHDDDTQEGEMFRTDEEREFEHEQMGLGADRLIAEDHRSKTFLDRADKLYAGLAYICSWSSTREEALEFAQPLHDRALLRISQEDLVECLLRCFARWNSPQPGEYEMIGPGGCFREDWSPRAVRYAFGKMDYPGRAECSTASPFRMGRAMRLPGGIQDGNLQEEDEWRIALDLSEVSSSIRTERMVKTELMPGRLGSIALSSESDELEPMISFNGSTGLWLNDINLNEADSFRVETL